MWRLIKGQTDKYEQVGREISAHDVARLVSGFLLVRANVHLSCAVSVTNSMVINGTLSDVHKGLSHLCFSKHNSCYRSNRNFAYVLLYWSGSLSNPWDTSQTIVFFSAQLQALWFNGLCAYMHAQNWVNYLMFGFPGLDAEQCDYFPLQQLQKD